jgi:peptidoglycan/LPS O-acetylase OafA/YrhL
MKPMTFASIQTFRAIAANSVVLAHLATIETKYAHGFGLLPPWVNFAGWSGVHFFFVISGFVMLIADRSSWSGFLSARLIRIFPVYWIYTSLVLAVFLIAPGIVNSSYTHAPSILKSYLLWPQDVDPLLSVGWTLIHEMYFYLVLTALLALAVPLRFALVGWALIIAAGFYLIPSQPPGAISVLFSPLTMEFILGAAIGLLIRSGFSSFARSTLAIGAALCILGAVCYVRLGIAYDDVPTSIMLLGLPFIFIVYGAAALELRGGWHRPAVLERLGDASYSTYLGHVLVLSALGRAFDWFPVHGLLIEAFFVVGCVIAVNWVGTLSYLYLERPILRLRRLWRREVDVKNDRKVIADERA